MLTDGVYLIDIKKIKVTVWKVVKLLMIIRNV